ncbi:hypothetical protein SAMN04487904_112157 [Actinopolyspora lacussalsi subsp. righensis]|uniref:Uncharacterized protein n=1 Tax=Actinopolyspora righensis TaxID=995060 RepID=A0A1I7BSN0_9ACTN|nr:hypothetical protein [Actinopolyspora righensis]SFT72616.1 hypothetical protein SAMN04487904_106263 [Actinopolyspora righensis]SFT90195.1 hypothetical protein SAMN04487904_112157 [Actinopolyspora righensis]
MSRPHTQLAVLLRRCQWMLDEAAYKLGGKRLPAADRHDLADALDELSAALREYRDAPTEAETDEDGPPTIVDPDS